MSDQARVVPFDARYSKNYADLNYAWIAETYGIEPHDREQLDDPEGLVIASGGEIFFALVGDAVAGTVAMIKMDEDHFELAKMAVSPEYQGRKIGDRLMHACIDFARERGAKSIILESNTKQVAALGLYRKHGFLEIPLDPNSHFARANIRMELTLAKL